MNWRSKWTSIGLIFTLSFLSIAPQAVFASTGPNQNTSSQGPQARRSKGYKRLGEMVEQRNQHTKYYLNSDGSTTAETSIDSRHYQDAQGKWQDISNKLVSSDEPGFELKNEANSFWTHFAKDSASNYLAKFKLDNETKVSWSLENANRVAETHDSNAVTYPDILQNTDLQYQPFADGLKENIILKNVNSPLAFQFDLTTQKLNPIQQADGSIALQDQKTGETKLVLPKPFMFDANHQLSRNVSMTLSGTQNPNVYTVVITPDSKWLSDPNRAYPITIDPTTTTQNWYAQVTSSSGLDTYVAENAPTTQYYSNNYMTTGHDVNLGRTRALLKFPLPSLPNGAIVTDGALSLYKYTTTSASSETLDAFRATSPWDDTVSWSNQPSVDTTNNQTEAGVASVAGSYTGWVNFNVFNIVKGWINGGITNYGFAVYHNQEYDPLFFYYSSNGSSTYSPMLSITYMTDEIGVNPYWDYANTSAGSVNTYNGNLISSVTDFSLPGRGIPISVTRTYNSRGNNLNGLFGQKWFSNLDMQLKFYSWGAVLLDSAGTERPFMLKSDGNTYSAPDNYPMQLYKDTSGSSTVYHVQEANQEAGSYQSQLPSVTFDSNGKLIHLDDGKGNSTTLSWGTSTLTLKDPSGRTATVALNTDGTANSVTTSEQSGVTKVSYTYSGGYLNSVTYDNGTYTKPTVNYEWNGSQLASFTDKSQIKKYINYNSNNQVISVGTVNMVANPSMEASPDGINLDNWSPAVSADSGSIKQNPIKNYGRYGMDIQSVLQSGTTGTSYLYATQKIPVKPSQSYTLSSLIKTVNLGGSATPNTSTAKAFLNVDQLDANGNPLYIWSNSGSISGTTDWTQNSVNITAGASTAYLLIYTEVSHDSTHFGGDAYFDGVQLEPGSNLSPFEGKTDFCYGADGGFESVWMTTPTGELTEYKNDNYGTPVAIIKDPKDSTKAKSETDLSWDPSDHLRSLTTPVQVNQNTGKQYKYSYDAVGNMTQASDPVSNTTSMNYYYNRLQKLTQADGSTVQHVWDPVNLNQDTQIDQTLNSKAYSYNQGNATTESNLLGVADNRILNSNFEQLSGNQPVNWSAYTPSGTVTNQDEYVASAPFNDINGGSHVLHINPGTNSYAYQWTDFIDLGGNTTEPVTISGYLKTGQTGSSNGASINVYWYDSNKSQISAVRLFNVRNTDWQRYVATLQPPSSGASYAKVMAITYGPYDGYFDNIMFEKSSLARGYNFLENSSFERQTLQWSASDSYASVVNDGSNAYSGSYDAKVNLPSIGTSYLQSQTVLPVSPGQYYTLLGYIRTNNIVAGSGGGGARLHVYFYDSNGGYINDYATTPPVTQTSGWTKYVMPFTPPANSATIKVRVELANAQGSAFFDNIRLSPGKLATASAYDSKNNYVASTTDPLGNTTSYSYQSSYQDDFYGHPTQVTAPSGSNTYYSYDGQEQLRTVKDNAGNTTTYGLDANGNVTSAALASGATQYDSESFAYDRDGNLTTETDANHNITQYSFDEGGRINQKTNPNGSTVSTAYDPYGYLSQISLSNGPSYNYGYDLEGHLTSSSISNGPSFQYGYDAVGNLISFVEKNATGNTVTSISGPSVGMYSSLNQLLQYNLKYNGSTTSVTFAFDYTKSGLINSVTADGQKFSFNYDENNNLVSKTNPDNTQDQFTYNDANQIKSTQTVDNNNSVKWSSQYQYDADGRVTSVTGTDPGNSSTLVSYSVNYTYNGTNNNTTESLNRLTKAEITNGSYYQNYFYTYDPAGNLLTMDVPNGDSTPIHQTFSYDPQNNDNQIKNPGFSYDTNGNLTSGVINGKSYQYEYDANNRLITVKDGNGNLIASYTYDGNGNRLTKKDKNNVITTYHYFQGQLLYETLSTDPSNVIHALYLRSPNGTLEAVSLNYVVGGTGNSYYYYHYNAQGDVVAVTDGNGAVYRQYVYDPYGNVISVKDGTGNPVDINNDTGFNNAYTYRGYHYDSDTGLYYLNVRYYEAGIGRFLTKDRVLGDAKDTQSLNRYAYCEGDPVDLVDHKGTRPDVTGGPESPDVYTKAAGNPYRPPITTSLGTVIITGRGKLGPDTDATGPHSTFKRDPDTGQIKNYRTWGSNPKNPSGFDEVFGYDSVGDAHYNKVTGEYVPTPHVHEPETPGGVRPALPDEMPEMPFLEDIPIFFD